MRILIADDEAETVNSLKNVLERKGHYVHTVYDGHEAFKYIRGNHYDIAFLDHNMPEYTGLEIAQYIKENNLPVKVVMITGDPDMKAVLAMPLGASDYITKPFRINDIDAVLDKYCKETQ